MKNIQAVFLDRDGTIGGNGHYMHPKDFYLYPRAMEAIGLLKAAGLKLFTFSNQHLISEGIVTMAEFTDQLREYGFDEIYICPHLPNAGCECRKPRPGMLHQAARTFGLDLTRCVVVGDIGPADMVAADAAGAKKVLVLTGQGQHYWTDLRHTWAHVDPDYVATDISDATRWILQQDEA